MSSQLLERLVVPVATKDDAERTVRQLLSYESEPDLHIVHVIEKGGGAPDKAPLEAREQQATTIFEFLEAFVGERGSLTTERRYGTDVVEEIVASADEQKATAIAFVPRPSGRITRVLTGDKTRKLVANGQIPVLVLPAEATE